MLKFDKIFRHGDVLIFKLAEYPTVSNTIKKVSQLILEEGEVTGHAHRLKGNIEVLHEDPLQKEITFHVLDKAVLTHEEHDRIVLESGFYVKASQVEYNPYTNMVSWIRD